VSVPGVLASVVVAFAFGAHAQYAGPIFDAHLHYNDDAVGPYPPAKVGELLRANGVKAILANSRPNDGTRALHEAARKGELGGAQVVAYIRVYRNRDDYAAWFGDPAIHRMIVEEEKRGIYKGVGEFHVHGAANASTPVVKRIVDFAVSKNLVLHAHCDEDALEAIFALNPKARVIWAHTGFSTPLARVEELLKKHPQMWGELSYRADVTDGGKLSAGWRDLFTRYPGRFLVGSDTWTHSRWESYGSIIGAYRQWLAELPADVAERVAWRNGAELFGVMLPK
jgi:hypothetical protein